ncbi:ATP-binding protein [Floccifex sp.]|uniref:ATP-binding protein n=1 Tax=Floccifex sp. TaxID=2815810 RepID=UPI003F10324D
MKFIGRQKQLSILERMFKKDFQQVALIYGRRRIGKSELIKQSLRSCQIRSIYYECKETNEMNNVDSLSTLISESYQFPKPSFSSLEQLLEFLFQQGKNEPVIIVLDEYPYLRKTIKGLDSILQSLIDRYKDNSKLKMILCGSYVDIMKSLLEHQNPLYGRIDVTIDLKPMNYYESSLFYPSFSCEDKVRLYSVFGGIPYYNRLIDESLSVKENIIELIASNGARLENEIEMYLRLEISKMTNANEVFEALASGHSRYQDILSKSHVSSGPTMVDILNRLIQMEIVKKETPINQENNRKKVRYRIIDNLTNFYYRYIFRYSSQINVMNPNVFYDRYIKEDFESIYVPKIFEEICRQYLISQNRNGLMDPPFEKIGKYYYDLPENHSNGEFDIVTFDSNGYIFYEAKFRKSPLNKNQIQQEIEQVKSCGLPCYRYGFISRSGFETEPEENMIFISLDQLYK